MNDPGHVFSESHCPKHQHSLNIVFAVLPILSTFQTHSHPSVFLLLFQNIRILLLTDDAFMLSGSTIVHDQTTGDAIPFLK